MSSTTRHKFALWAPDYTDAECLSRRLAVRPKHLENAKILTSKGILQVGGAMIGEESHLTDAPKMEGSLIIYEAESIEEVRKIVETDVYYTGNVWDKERLQIVPFKAATWP